MGPQCPWQPDPFHRKLKTARSNNVGCHLLPSLDPAVTVVQDGKTVAFCCKGCIIGEFQKDPAECVAKLK
jgi:hypothetical protein